MDKTTLMLVMALLLVIFILLVAVYVWNGRTKKDPAVSCEALETFGEMCAVIHKNTSTNTQLNHAVDTIIERYSHIDDFEAYGALLEKLCIHPATDSKVILRFQKALISENPHFKDRIEQTLKLGLAGRK